VLKRVFDGGHVLVTTVRRVHVRMVFACFCFNLLQLRPGGGLIAWAIDLLGNEGLGRIGGAVRVRRGGSGEDRQGG